MAKIEFTHISKTFGSLKALKPINLTIHSGQFTSLLGPSGCGKTTLLRILAGLESPDTGEIRVDGEVFFSQAQRIDTPAYKRKFGMVFQDFALWPHLTVFENVAFGLRAARQTKELKERVNEALKRVRLQGLENRFPHQLSGGQQQRVAFARAVVMSPRLILFDEPLSALDAILRDELRLEMTRLIRELGITALYVTHDQTEAMSMSDQVIVMQSGEIIQQGTPEYIYQKPSHPFTANFIGKSNWIEQDTALVRPEHLLWSAVHGSEPGFDGMIRHISYMGDRYEVQLEMAEIGTGMWTAYHNERLQVGEKVRVYVSPQNIHRI